MNGLYLYGENDVKIRVGNRPSVTRQTGEQTAEIFDLVSSRLMIPVTESWDMHESALWSWMTRFP